MEPPKGLFPWGEKNGPILAHEDEQHQLFVIARVQGRYRCIAAFSSQWLFGHMVVNAADRLIRAFINPINAAAIASELASLDELEIEAIAGSDNVDDEDINPAILCPYLTGLFMTAFRVDMGRNRLHALRLLHIYTLPSDCQENHHNKHGYTCFDVTEPGKPRFCFWWPGTGPLSALGYLRKEEAGNRVDTSILRLLKHCPRVDVSTLAGVWPADFNQHLKPGRAPAAAQATGPANAASPPCPTSALTSTISTMLSSNHSLSSAPIASALKMQLARPENLGVLRNALLAAEELNPNGVFLLKLLVAAERHKFVDLKPWVSTGALDAGSLVDFSDALQHAEYLDLSFSSTLTAEILEDFVRRLPNLRHVVAFGCRSLGPLTTVLPLTSYLASLPLLDAVDQSRLHAPHSISIPECLRWVEESDPPPALTVVMYSPSLEVNIKDKVPRQYGVELAHFGVEGLVHGFTRFLEHLYDSDYHATQSGCYFEMRAYFHLTCAVSVRDCVGPASWDTAACYAFGCLPSLIRDGKDAQIESSAGSGSLTAVPRQPGWVLVLDTKGTMPYHNPAPKPAHSESDSEGFQLPPGMPPATLELLKQIGLDGFDLDAYADQNLCGPNSKLLKRMKASPTGRGNDLWLLSLGDAPKTTADPFLGDGPSARPQDASSPGPSKGPHPEYAFERWDVPPDQERKTLSPVERISVREWVGRMPAGHGCVSEAVLSKCEAVLARLNVQLRRLDA
ncbi:hypothetical protein AURDEDRAFT_170516 [Auricularia subglabra TFB-10046 SS5]|nr:hypothetical protein AURDEDRAFT_170516 [Auricularia subglabra TFB-10046 SS5]